MFRLLNAKNNHTLLSQVTIACFSLFIITSGVFCFLLDKEWVRNLTPASKVPLYFAVGISICFTVTFALVDCINFVLRHCLYVNNYILSSGSQTCTVLLTTIIAGAFFGMLFGTLDVEDDFNGMRFAQDKNYTLPVGCALGCINGMVNYVLMKPRSKGKLESVV